MESSQRPQADRQEQQRQKLRIVSYKVERPRKNIRVEQIKRSAGQARHRTERITQPAVDTETGQQKRRCHNQLQCLIQPGAGPMGTSHQPIKAWAIMMKSGRPQSIVNDRKPARPIDALLEGPIHGRAAVRMHLRIRSVHRSPGELPEWEGEKYGQQGDEKKGPQTGRKTCQHSSEYTEPNGHRTNTTLIRLIHMMGMIQ